VIFSLLLACVVLSSTQATSQDALGWHFFLPSFDIGDGLLWTVACHVFWQLAPTPLREANQLDCEAPESTRVPRLWC
jgi:hypothetical protein